MGTRMDRFGEWFCSFSGFTMHPIAIVHGPTGSATSFLPAGVFNRLCPFYYISLGTFSRKSERLILALGRLEGIVNSYLHLFGYFGIGSIEKRGAGIFLNLVRT